MPPAIPTRSIQRHPDTTQFSFSQPRPPPPTPDQRAANLAANTEITKAFANLPTRQEVIETHEAAVALLERLSIVVASKEGHSKETYKAALSELRLLEERIDELASMEEVQEKVSRAAEMANLNLETMTLRRVNGMSAHEMEHDTAMKWNAVKMLKGLGSRREWRSVEQGAKRRLDEMDDADVTSGKGKDGRRVRRGDSE